MKKLIEFMFGHWLQLPLYFFLEAFLLYLTILIPYLFCIVTGTVFGILLGVFPHYLDFTKDYFYSGKFLGFADAWRVHVVYYVICYFLVVAHEENV